jgi:hypothetical protein
MAITTTQESEEMKEAGFGTSGSQPDKIMSAQPDDNVDQDGHCVTAAYGESTTLNSGEACDDGRAGK